MGSSIVAQVKYNGQEFHLASIDGETAVAHSMMFGGIGEHEEVLIAPGHAVCPNCEAEGFCAEGDWDYIRALLMLGRQECESTERFI